MQSSSFYTRKGETLVPILGWFSLGLGLAEIAAPKKVAKLAGLSNGRGVVKAFGVREVISGFAVLAAPVAKYGLWARVAGDLLDLAVVGKGLAESESLKRRRRLKTAAAAILGITALDLYSSYKETAGDGYSRTRGAALPEPVIARESVTIKKPAEDLYLRWRNFSKLPRFFSFLEMVEEISEKQSRWKLKSFAGLNIEWVAELLDDKPGTVISWRTIEGSDISHAGSVSFKATGRGGETILTAELQFTAGGRPSSRINKAINWLGEHKLKHDLRRFKQLMETGEIATTKCQPAGRRSGETMLDKIARA